MTQKPQQRTSVQTVLPNITDEQQFYYLIAIYGGARSRGCSSRTYDEWAFYDNVDVYGEKFDNDNYKRAMADEFERGKYRARIRAKIEDEVRKVNFTQRFTQGIRVTLGEYLFEYQSFPIIDNGSPLCHYCVNENQFIVSSIPMSEAEASAFVKNRTTASGKVNRTFSIRYIYSVLNYPVSPRWQGSFQSSKDCRPLLKYFIYSVEASVDEGRTWKLFPRNSLVPSTAEEWRVARIAAQTATKEIGKYRYIASCEKRFSESNRLFGTITLTDVGFTLSGDQPNRGSWLQNVSFVDSKKSTPDRYNSTYNVMSGSCGDFHVNGFGGHDFETEQERDRFFTDLSLSFQEWKTKYAPFQFATVLDY